MCPYCCKDKALLFESAIIEPFLGLKDDVVSVVIPHCHSHAGGSLLKCKFTFEVFFDGRHLLDPQVASFGKLVYIYGCILVPFGSEFACDLSNESRGGGH